MLGFGHLGLGIDLQLLEKQLAQLTRRIDIEATVAGYAVYLILYGGQLSLKMHRIFGKTGGIDPNPRAFHIGEHPYERLLYLQI